MKEGTLKTILWGIIERNRLGDWLPPVNIEVDKLTGDGVFVYYKESGETHRVHQFTNQKFILGSKWLPKVKWTECGEGIDIDYDGTEKAVRSNVETENAERDRRDKQNWFDQRVSLRKLRL